MSDDERSLKEKEMFANLIRAHLSASYWHERDALEYLQSCRSFLSDYNEYCQNNEGGSIPSDIIKKCWDLIENFLQYLNPVIIYRIICKSEPLDEMEEIRLKCLRLPIDIIGWMIDNLGDRSHRLSDELARVMNDLCDWLDRFSRISLRISSRSWRDDIIDITERILICLCKYRLWCWQYGINGDGFTGKKNMMDYLEHCFNNPRSSEKMKLAAAINICLPRLINDDGEQLIDDARAYLRHIRDNYCGERQYLGLDTRMIRELSLIGECVEDKFTLTKELTDLKLQLKSKDETNEKMTSKIGKLTKKITSLNSELKYKDETNKDLQNEMDRKTKEQEDKDKEHELTKTINAKLLNMKSDMEKLKRELEMKNEELRKYDSEQKCKDERIKELTESIEKVNKNKETEEKEQVELVKDVLIESERDSYLMSVSNAVVSFCNIIGQTNMYFFFLAVLELERREREYSDLVHHLIEIILQYVPVEPGYMEIYHPAIPEEGHVANLSDQV